LQIGFVRRTKRGREITRAAYDHLGMTMPQTKKESAAAQPELFEEQ